MSKRTVYARKPWGGHLRGDRIEILEADYPRLLRQGRVQDEPIVERPSGAERGNPYMRPIASVRVAPSEPTITHSEPVNVADSEREDAPAVASESTPSTDDDNTVVKPIWGPVHTGGGWYRVESAVGAYVVDGEEQRYRKADAIAKSEELNANR